MHVHNDGTTSNEDRLGAIGDIAFVGLEDDLLAIASDNLFDYSLADYEPTGASKDGSCVAVHDVGDLGAREEVRDRGRRPGRSDHELRREARESADDAVRDGDVPVSRVSTSALIATYLAEGNPPDQPGNLVAWLHKRAPVYAYRFPGEWYDIGDREQLLEADNRMRRREGLPERAEYSPS